MHGGSVVSLFHGARGTGAGMDSDNNGSVLADGLGAGGSPIGGVTRVLLDEVGQTQGGVPDSRSGASGRRSPVVLNRSRGMATSRTVGGFRRLFWGVENWNWKGGEEWDCSLNWKIELYCEGCDCHGLGKLLLAPSPAWVVVAVGWGKKKGFVICSVILEK